MPRGSTALVRAVVAMVFGGLAMIMLASPASAGRGPDCVDQHCWTFSPSAAPAGTLVHFYGQLPRYITADAIHQHLREQGPPFLGLNSDSGYPPGTTYPDGCPGFHNSVEQLRYRINARTRIIRGSFTVGRTGFCAYQDVPERDASTTAATLPGTYTIVFRCSVCVEGEFTVNNSPSTLAFTGAPVAFQLAASLMLLALGGGLLLLARLPRRVE